MNYTLITNEIAAIGHDLKNNFRSIVVGYPFGCHWHILAARSEADSVLPEILFVMSVFAKDGM